MLFASLTACLYTDEPEDTAGENESSEYPTEIIYVTDTEARETRPIDTSPSYDTYEGLIISIATRPESRYKREFGLTVAENPVDEKIAKRNSQIEKNLDVMLNIVEVPELWTDEGFRNYVTTEYQSGARGEADMIAAKSDISVAPSLRGFYVNYFDKDALGEYFRVYSKSINYNYVNQAAYRDRLYYLVGELNFSVYDWSVAVHVNMDLAEDKGLSSEELYNTVLQKKWTYEYFYNIVSNLSDDKNGVADYGDRVVLSAVNDETTYDGFMHSFGISIYSQLDDASFIFDANNNEKLKDGISKMKKLYSVSGVYLDEVEKVSNTFFNGNSVFLIDVINREKRPHANFEHVVFPLPMYEINKDQYYYYTTPSKNSYNVMSVLNNEEDKLDAIGTTLMLLMITSEEDVRPFYIRHICKKDYVSGHDSVATLEYALLNVTFDISKIYGFKTTALGEDAIFLTDAMWRLQIEGETNIDDRWQKLAADAESALTDHNDWFLKNK